jgi:zinc protease
MLLDRTIVPKPATFNTIELPAIIQETLPNGIPLYVVNIGLQPIVRFELIFEAGNKYESKLGQSFFTIKMMAEGTKKFTSSEIAEKFAAIGYFYEFTQGSERAIFTLNGLTKHFESALEILSELLENPTFPLSEFDNLKTFTKQQIAVNLEKTAYLASVAFKENVFGAKHYIGANMTDHDIDAINQTDLADFFNENISNKAFKIMAAGQVGDFEINCIKQYFGNKKASNKEYKSVQEVATNYKGKQIFIEKKEALQTTIRIGRRIIDRNHADYYKLKVANTILGGFFGSRLMKNIREDKGYTYGISSSLLAIPNNGYLMIGTDVKREFTSSTLFEIYKEIEILQNELVDDTELETVKNYIIGSHASSLNSPFDIADKHKMIIYENLKANFYNTYVQNIKEVSPADVLVIFQKYYSKNELIEITVGSI